ncbi:MAG: 2-oxoacid:acceptor oxidoreductase family protein [Chloroflexi bacterium]|nr:2-oxoacid:acceptor oxidoreductase family protein [Chloroflexota bacterium]
MADKFEIRICGFGGQGVILAGFILGQAAAIFKGQDAVFIQDYGPEARGGACRADVVISDQRVLYPYITNPSLLIVMSQVAYDKFSSQSDNDTLLIVDEDLVEVGAARWKRVLSIPATRMAEELGRVAVANIVMLGFVTAVTRVVSVEEMKQSVQASVPKGTEELNMRAFESGYAYGLEKLQFRPEQE